MSQTYSVIGTRPIRHDGVDKVTGRALYGADFQAAGPVARAILRSPHAHAKIKKIDVSKALALPGVEQSSPARIPRSGDRMATLAKGRSSLRDLSSTAWRATRSFTGPGRRRRRRAKRAHCRGACKLIRSITKCCHA